MIDAADPEKLIFQKALLIALDQRKTLLLEQDQIMHLLLNKATIKTNDNVHKKHDRYKATEKARYVD